MKLSEVPTGGWFRFDGEYFVKTGPLKGRPGNFSHAICLKSGRQRFHTDETEIDADVIVIPKPHWVG